MQEKLNYELVIKNSRYSKSVPDDQIIKYYKINVKKIAFEKKEHTTDNKMGVSVLLRFFMSSNELCNITYAL